MIWLFLQTWVWLLLATSVGVFIGWVLRGVIFPASNASAAADEVAVRQRLAERPVSADALDGLATSTPPPVDAVAQGEGSG